MDVLLIGAIVIGAFLLANSSGAFSSLLGGSSQPTAADQEIQAGGSAILNASAQGSSIYVRSQAQTQQLNSATGKTIIGSVGAGAMAGVGVATSATGTIAGAAMTAGITAGIGIAIGIAITLWMKHEARIAGAKEENSQWNEIFPAWSEMMQGIFQAYNSGQIDKPTAAAEVLQAKTLAYNAAQKMVGTPGTNWTGGQVNGIPGGLISRLYWKATCDKHCTVGCCLFNNVVGPASNQALDMFTGNTTQKVINVPKTFSSSYGYSGSAAFQLVMTR